MRICFILRTRFVFGGKLMGTLWVYIGTIASVLLFINCVSLLKKIKKEEDTLKNTLYGSLLAGLAFFSIIMLCGR
jgi:hypothetical protein